jgi:hypothetical protein
MESEGSLSYSNQPSNVFVFWEGPRSKCYGRTVALRLIVHPCDENEEKGDQFFQCSK